MGSEFLSLSKNDWVRGAVMALLGGVVAAIGGEVTQSGFDVFHANWVSIGQLAVNGAFAGGIAYILKNLLSDQNGKVLGRIG